MNFRFFSAKRTTLTGLLIVCLAFAVSSPIHAKRIAGIFGSNYKGNQADIPELELCEADAEMMKQALISQGRFDDVKVLLGRMVTATNLQQAIAQIAAEAGPTDTVVLYFSGHGAFQRDAAAPNGLRNFIIMFERPHVSDDQLNQWLRGIRTQKTAFVFDACFSGGIAKKGTRGASDIPVPQGAPGTVIENGDDSFYFQGKAIIGSSDSNETSIEIGSPVNHGIFTYYFAQGLDPANGDLNKDHTVTILEAFEWSKNRVTEHALRLKHHQNPQITGNASGILVAGNITPTPPQPQPEPVHPQPNPNDNPQPSPIQPPPTPSDPVDPVTPDEPPVVNNGDTGSATIYTTVLEGKGAGSQSMNPGDILRRNRGEIAQRRATVLFSGKTYQCALNWLDHDQLKAATGEDIPLGIYTFQGRDIPNKVASFQCQGIPTGVHEVELRADDYPVVRESLGIEKSRPGKLFIVTSLSGYGMIRGHVYMKNFESPVQGQDVWMPTVIGTTQVFRMRTTSDGSFWFLNLPPRTDYTIKASFRENLPLDGERLRVDSGTVTKVDVVLTQ